MIREIVKHPQSGERYILETGGTCPRAYGPLQAREQPEDHELRDYLDNQPDAEDDGEWLMQELATT